MLPVPVSGTTCGDNRQRMRAGQCLVQSCKRRRVVVVGGAYRGAEVEQRRLARLHMLRLRRHPLAQLRGRQEQPGGRLPPRPSEKAAAGFVDTGGGIADLVAEPGDESRHVRRA